MVEKNGEQVSALALHNIDASEEAGHASNHGREHTRAWTTHWHFSKHVACSEVGKVEAKLG